MAGRVAKRGQLTLDAVPSAPKIHGTLAPVVVKIVIIHHTPRLQGDEMPAEVCTALAMPYSNGKASFWFIRPRFKLRNIILSNPANPGNVPAKVVLWKGKQVAVALRLHPLRALETLGTWGIANDHLAVFRPRDLDGIEYELVPVGVWLRGGDLVPNFKEPRLLSEPIAFPFDRGDKLTIAMARDGLQPMAPAGFPTVTILNFNCCQRDAFRVTPVGRMLVGVDTTVQFRFVHDGTGETVGPFAVTVIPEYLGSINFQFMDNANNDMMALARDANLANGRLVQMVRLVDARIEGVLRPSYIIIGRNAPCYLRAYWELSDALLRRHAGEIWAAMRPEVTRNALAAVGAIHELGDYGQAPLLPPPPPPGPPLERPPQPAAQGEAGESSDGGEEGGGWDVDEGGGSGEEGDETDDDESWRSSDEEGDEWDGNAGAGRDEESE